MRAESGSRRGRLAGRLAPALIALLAGAVGLAPQSASGGPAPVVPRTFYGTAPQTRLTDADIDRMGQGQLGTLRLLLSWGSIDREPGGGDDWSQFDPLVAAAARNGMQVVPFVYGTPEWVVRGLDGNDCEPQDCLLYAPRTPAALQEWARFLGAAAERYGPGGQFFAEHPEVPVSPIVAWQLWNEQNSKTFYLPQPDANAYASLVAAGSGAIHAVDPGAKVVLGGMFGSPGGEKNKKLLAWTFLRRLYAIPGFAEQFEGVGVHPYSQRMRKVKDQVRRMRAEMTLAGDPAAEMWITEIGWSSGRGKNLLEQGKRGQARRLRQAMDFFVRERFALNIQNVTWFAWRDVAGTPICQWCGKAGLFRARQLSPKPSWRALMNFTGGS